MTRLAILFSTFVFTFSAQAVNINGYLVVDQDEHLLIERDTGRTFKVQPSNSTVRKLLAQLTTFDGLRGQAPSKDGDTLLLQAIDFVSLRRLLGEWQDDSSHVSFEDYSRVKFEMNGSSRIFLYALSPGANNSWRIYLTDQSSVVLGSLIVEDKKATLEFYDPQTGQVAQSLHLSKVNSR